VLEYIHDTSRLPTFVSTGDDGLNGFITIRQHFPQSFEIHCLAVHAASRGKGLGRVLVEHAAIWARGEGGAFLQVKTIAESVPSPEYEETRAFYSHMGFVPLEVFPTLWSPRHPCLQLVKSLRDGG
jgi:GNAT superfamily N-acetyltransferase